MLPPPGADRKSDPADAGTSCFSVRVMGTSTSAHRVLRPITHVKNGGKTVNFLTPGALPAPTARSTDLARLALIFARGTAAHSGPLLHRRFEPTRLRAIIVDQSPTASKPLYTGVVRGRFGRLHSPTVSGSPLVRGCRRHFGSTTMLRLTSAGGHLGPMYEIGPSIVHCSPDPVADSFADT